MSAKRKRRAAEKAVVFHGRCPNCKDFPTGEWHDGSDFTSGCCGAELVAEIVNSKDDAEHWRFRFAFENEDGSPVRP